MFKFSNMFLAVAASTMMLSSCSSDEPATTQVVPAEGGVYATLTLQLPSRANTVAGDENTNSDDGFEIGNDSENNVGSVLVVIASKGTTGYSYVASNLADAHSATNTTTARPTYNVQFETRDLYDFAGQEVYVFAYCNPSKTLVSTISGLSTSDSKAFTDLTGNITAHSISTANGFFMSNASVSAAVTLPTQQQMNETFNTPENPFSLGVVNVERATARFDFRETTIGNFAANTYPIYNHNNSNLETSTPDGPVAFVELNGMALLNEAKEYYLLPRVSNNGLPTGDGFEICGRETPLNYVISANYALNGFDGKLTTDKLNEAFLYTGLASTSAIDFTTFQYEALGTNIGEDDDNNWTDTSDSNFNKTGYMIWKYVTENTIPQLQMGDYNYMQRLGVTTGVVFRGQLHAADTNNELGQAITNGTNYLYAFNGVLYGDLAMLKKQVLANPVSTLAEQFMTQFNITEITEEAVNGVSDLTSTVADGFAIYKPVNGKYYMYYAYKNRHFDNLNNTIMGPMEFGVVRNNIYKLSVSNILEFGHPGNPGDDPDPEDPDDPDETPKTYFRVQVKVLPWVVRVNNIIL
ncbi:MAG: Mfa1 family fimbria major subunit [Firmicutes bacterium]|nr:Mfa1 family fimbria major subunit [Bacillota bacterium]MCM1401785.1 Mfa1 family fimbria major subunit [Bacteroides sp.]MCM1477678.1 Mfa1 family fimbria major subunit [Bacteroides sp.]